MNKTKMENKNKLSTETIIDNFLDKQNYKRAAMIAGNAKLIDKQIQAYDSMIEHWGHIEPDAGYKMFNLGLFKKAKDYFEAYGEFTSPRYKDIKQMTFPNPEKFKENSETLVDNLYHYTYRYSDFNQKLIYYAKENNKNAIKDLKNTGKLMEKIKEECWITEGKN